MIFTEDDLSKDDVKLEKLDERKVVRNILKIFGDDCYQIEKPIRPSKKGSPDRQFIIKGKFFAIEMKRVGESARLLQVQRINQINRAGGYAFVANNWEDVERELKDKGVL